MFLGATGAMSQENTIFFIAFLLYLELSFASSVHNKSIILDSDFFCFHISSVCKICHHLHTTLTVTGCGPLKARWAAFHLLQVKLVSLCGGNKGHVIEDRFFLSEQQESGVEVVREAEAKITK